MAEFFIAIPLLFFALSALAAMLIYAISALLLWLIRGFMALPLSILHRVERRRLRRRSRPGPSNE